MLEKKSINRFLYVMPGIFILFFLCTHTPNIEYDTPSYIYFDPIRPLIYPLFIWLFHWAGQYQFTLIMWMQGILLYSALLYARFWLKKNLYISDFSIFLVNICVLATISFHFQVNYIQSEGLTFPLFIVFFYTLLNCFKIFNIKKIILLNVLVSILILTRLQFYYLYIVLGMLIGWYIWQRIATKLVALASIILLATITLTTLIDHSYHYVKHGFFGIAPYNGTLVLVQTLYLADNNAPNYFTNPVEKELVQKMIEKRNKLNLNQDAALVSTMKPSYLGYAYHSHYKNFVALQDVIAETFGKTEKFSANTLAIEINKKLLTHEAKNNLIFFVWKFIQCMGGIPLLIFFIILLIGIPFKIIINNIHEPDYSYLFINAMTWITFGNAFIVALCNPAVPAYFCYSQYLFYCFAAYLTSKMVGESNAI